jgi:hypothetical protein
VLLILASLLTACETTWQVHQGPNQAPEVTAARRVFTFYMTKTVSVPATLTLDPKDGPMQSPSVRPGGEADLAQKAKRSNQTMQPTAGRSDASQP